MSFELTTCPDQSCGQVAEVVDEWLAESTDGPVAHITTLCLFRHRFTTYAHTPQEEH